MSNDNEPTIGRLVANTSRDISALVHSEIALAKSEIKVSAKAGGIGAALLVVAAFFGALIVILGSFAIVYFITMTGLHVAWAFLIVTGAYALLAALLILIGIGKLKKIRAPEKTISTAKSIPSAFKGQSSAFKGQSSAFKGQPTDASAVDTEPVGDPKVESATEPVTEPTRGPNVKPGRVGAHLRK